jgi:hypothetical protein
MAVKSKSLMLATVVSWAVLGTTSLCSQSLLAQSASAEEPLRSQTKSATTAESAIAPPASQQRKNRDQPPSTKPRDQWDRATQLLGAAKAGDRDAQYDLFAVIDWCNIILKSYFTTDGRPLTLEEGLERAVNASQKRQAQEEFPHCHRFQDHNVDLELGSAEYWLDRASQSGQPLAQAETARRRLDQDFLNNAVPLSRNPSTGISISIPSGAPPDRRAVDLLRAAVKSLNPQVLEIIGDEQTALHGSRNNETVDRFAWIYVACQRGLDCSDTSQLAKDCAANCDVSTPEGLIMAWSGDEWPAVQQRAREINAKLDAGQWDELGLGSRSKCPVVTTTQQNIC